MKRFKNQKIPSVLQEAKNEIAIFPLALLIILMNGCTSPQDPFSYKEEYVVSCMLYVNEGIDTLKLRRTLPVDQTYDDQKAGINNARVKISDEFGDETQLTAIDNPIGCYVDRTGFQIHPHTRYFLTINLSNGKQIAGDTVTPDTFSVSAPQNRTIKYLQDTNTVRWTKAKGASAYVVIVTNLEQNKTKIDRGNEIISDNQYFSKDAATIWTFTLERSTSLYSWLYNYYGVHRVAVVAVDTVTYDYLWTMYQDKMQLNEPSYHLNNAVGYFGSGSRRSFNYEVRQ